MEGCKVTKQGPIVWNQWPKRLHSIGLAPILLSWYIRTDMVFSVRDSQLDGVAFSERMSLIFMSIKIRKWKKSARDRLARDLSCPHWEFLLLSLRLVKHRAFKSNKWSDLGGEGGEKEGHTYRNADIWIWKIAVWFTGYNCMIVLVCTGAEKVGVAPACFTTGYLSVPVKGRGESRVGKRVSNLEQNWEAGPTKLKSAGRQALNAFALTVAHTRNTHWRQETSVCAWGSLKILFSHDSAEKNILY